MQNIYSLIDNMYRVRLIDVPSSIINEYDGYPFRTSNGELDALIAVNSNVSMAFYAPRDTDDNNGSFRWFNGTSNNRSIVMTLDGNGNLDCLGDVTGFNSAISDSNFKENIRAYDDWNISLDKLRPVRYTWNEDTPIEEKRGVEDIGLIAQEVAEAYPLAHDIKMIGDRKVEIVRYEKLVPLLLAVVKDQQKRIETLEKSYDNATFGNKTLKIEQTHI